MLCFAPTTPSLLGLVDEDISKHQKGKGRKQPTGGVSWSGQDLAAISPYICDFG